MQHVCTSTHTSIRHNDMTSHTCIMRICIRIQIHTYIQVCLFIQGINRTQAYIHTTGMHQWSLFVQALTLFSGVMIITEQFTEILGEKGGQGIAALGGILVFLHVFVAVTPSLTKITQKIYVWNMSFVRDKEVNMQPCCACARMEEGDADEVCMYVCMVCMCVCVNVCVCAHVCMCERERKRRGQDLVQYLCMYVCVYIYIYACESE